VIGVKLLPLIRIVHQYGRSVMSLFDKRGDLIGEHLERKPYKSPPGYNSRATI